MKKIQLWLTTLSVVIVTCGVIPVHAQQAKTSTKVQMKAAEKAGKSRAKSLKKEKWLTDSAEPMESIIMHHLLKTENYGGTGSEYVGNAQAVKNTMLGGRMARSDVRTQYADMNKAMVKGRINDQSQSISEDQAETFIAAYETMVMQEFDGDLQQSYSIYRQTKDGKYEVRVYFILDEVKASKARIKALKHAADEAKIAQQIADDMSKFINDGFKNNVPNEESQ